MSAVLQADEASALLEASINGELPDERGRFGPFGGRYVPETLVPAFERLEDGVRKYLHDADFQAEYQRELREWVGRPTALTYAPRLSKSWGVDVWLKREDLAHTGAHKINNAIGQALLAKRLGAMPSATSSSTTWTSATRTFSPRAWVPRLVASAASLGFRSGSSHRGWAWPMSSPILKAPSATSKTSSSKTRKDWRRISETAPTTRS